MLWLSTLVEYENESIFFQIEIEELETETNPVQDMAQIL